MSDTPRSSRSGYGNIYTPHAGSMIITVQRESGLANRTITLTQRQVRFFRIALYVASTLVVIVGGSWLFLATQAARVPMLTKQVTTLRRDVQRVDTLRQALADMEHRFQQVQHMLGVTSASGGVSAPAQTSGSTEREKSAAPTPPVAKTHPAPAAAANRPDTMRPSHQDSTASSGSDTTTHAPF
jgi:hypothetical protein